jgi:glycerophosphoryl diester phosphodiesterase
MSVDIVVHKGLKNILYDNSLVGILATVFKNKFCEFDILFVDGVWRLCHDFNVLSMYHSRLSELLNVLEKNKNLVKNNVIIDVKWDFVINRHDSLFEAVGQLKQELLHFADYPFLIQASNTRILEAIISHLDGWNIGLIVSNMNDFYTYSEFLNFGMVSLTDFTSEEIGFMSEKCNLFGYTCHNTNELSKYKHLFKYLKGIVCDVSL